MSTKWTVCQTRELPADNEVKLHIYIWKVLHQPFKKKCNKVTLVTVLLKGITQHFLTYQDHHVSLFVSLPSSVSPWYFINF